MSFIKEPKKKQIEGLTIDDILSRYLMLSQIKDLPGDKLCYARQKNLMALRPFEKLNSPGERIPLTDKYKEYQKKYSELRSKYIVTDEAGKAVLTKVQTAYGPENSTIIDVANPQLIKAIKELDATFEAAIKERENDIKAYKEFLSEIVPEADIPGVFRVNIDDVSGLTQTQWDAVIWFVDENNGQKSKSAD